MSDIVQRFKDDINKVIDVLIGIIDIVDKVSKKVNKRLAVKLTTGCDTVDNFLYSQQNKKLSYLSYYLCIKITALDDFTTLYLYPLCQLHHHNYYMFIDNGEQLYCYMTQNCCMMQNGVCYFISNNSLEKQLIHIFW